MQKTITHLEHPRQNHMVWDGFRVSQYIPWYGREMSGDTSPFLMLDYNAPWKIEPQKVGHRPGVGFHPHRGFETVTIVYSWEVEHEDTAWNGGTIWADEVQWMTAGSGLLHNEFMTAEFSRMGGVQHAVQLWINLPRKDKMTPPRYQPLTRESIPEVEFVWGRVRVIAGEFQWILWAAKTYSPVELYDIRFDYTGSLDITLPEGYTSMLLIAEGESFAWEKYLQNGDMVHFSKSGTDITLTSSTKAKLLLMAGKPLDEPVVAHGPFVMNTHEEIRQAFEDFQSGKMGSIGE